MSFCAKTPEDYSPVCYRNAMGDGIFFFFFFPEMSEVGWVFCHAALVMGLY